MIDQAYVDRMSRRLQDLEEKMALPEITGEQKKFQAVLADHARQKRVYEKAARYVRLMQEKQDSQVMLEEEADEEMAEMARAELARIEKDLPAAEKEFQIALLPPDPVGDRNIIMEIRAGTGGDEAALFAGDLYRMYTRYAETQQWKTAILDASPTDLGGFKEVIFSVEGDAVYDRLRFESGGHRVQRIPTTESGGRIHTSAATVAVLPEAQAVDEIEVSPEELQIDVYRASGAGGQHVNTTDSAVRITHIPTGIVVQSQDERSQHRNKDKAMKVLMARLLDRKREEEESKLAAERKGQIGSGDRSQRIRTYNFPQNRVTDHRINLTLYSLDRLMQGDMDELTGELMDHHLEQRLQAELNQLEV